METKALAKSSSSKMEVVATTSPTPLTLLQQAIATGMDLAQLEKLMEMQERWEKNQARKAFFDALTRFQAMAPAIKKNKTAKINSDKGNYSYRYAELGAITATIKGALNECGLSYRWAFKENNGKLIVSCHISHRDGHTEITEMESGKDTSGGKNAIQQIGSTQTYLQRYTLIGGLGLSTADEDNDGRGAPSSQPEQPQPTEEDILSDWKKKVDEVKTRVELTALFMSNKKAVEKNPNIQAIFKARQEQLPPVTKTNLP